MSNMVKVCRCLSGMFLNQSITEEEFFHWLSDVLVSYFGVDSLEYLFTNSSYFAFGWID